MVKVNKKILIVEDEEALADVLKAKLTKQGYDTEVAGDGQAGYKKIKDWRPDLVLLDIVMPKMNGYEVLEKLNEDGDKTPVIIISNSGQPVEIEKTKKLGAIDCLVKTQFDPKEVVEKVNKYLDGQIDSGEKAKKQSEGNLGGTKVLIVEDDSFLREICVKKLIKEGFNVQEAVDGEQALKMINEIIPDIILLDIILPALDGFQVLSAIRSDKNPKISKIPIIVLSNLGQDEDIDKAMKMGANNYLIKAHFTTDEIVKNIKKVLENK